MASDSSSPVSPANRSQSSGLFHFGPPEQGADERSAFSEALAPTVRQVSEIAHQTLTVLSTGVGGVDMLPWPEDLLGKRPSPVLNDPSDKRGPIDDADQGEGDFNEQPLTAPQDVAASSRVKGRDQKNVRDFQRIHRSVFYPVGTKVWIRNKNLQGKIIEEKSDGSAVLVKLENDSEPKIIEMDYSDLFPSLINDRKTKYFVVTGSAGTSGKDETLAHWVVARFTGSSSGLFSFKLTHNSLDSLHSSQRKESEEIQLSESRVMREQCVLPANSSDLYQRTLLPYKGSHTRGHKKFSTFDFRLTNRLDVKERSLDLSLGDSIEKPAVKNRLRRSQAIPISVSRFYLPGMKVVVKGENDSFEEGIFLGEIEGQIQIEIGEGRKVSVASYENLYPLLENNKKYFVASDNRSVNKWLVCCLNRIRKLSVEFSIHQELGSSSQMTRELQIEPHHNCQDLKAEGAAAIRFFGQKILPYVDEVHQAAPKFVLSQRKQDPRPDREILYFHLA